MIGIIFFFVGTLVYENSYPRFVPCILWMALYLCVVLGHYKAETSADCCVVVAVPCTMTRDHFLSCWNIGLHQSGDPVAVILNTILLAKPLWTIVLLWTYLLVHSWSKIIGPISCSNMDPSEWFLYSTLSHDIPEHMHIASLCSVYLLNKF